MKNCVLIRGVRVLDSRGSSSIEFFFEFESSSRDVRVPESFRATRTFFDYSNVAMYSTLIEYSILDELLECFQITRCIRVLTIIQVLEPLRVIRIIFNFKYEKNHFSKVLMILNVCKPTWHKMSSILICVYCNVAWYHENIHSWCHLNFRLLYLF